MLRHNKTDVKIWNEDFKDDTTKDIVEHDNVQKIAQIQPRPLQIKTHLKKTLSKKRGNESFVFSILKGK